MTSTESDRRFLTESLPQLQDYLLSAELYWPLDASLPRLTIGAVLLALARLSATQPAEAERLKMHVEAVHAKWKVAWEQKSARETANRLRLWTQFISDYRSAPEQQADSYPQEVRGRVILQLLHAAQTTETDLFLKSRLVPGGFIWDADLESAFPMADFWFLYGKLSNRS
jgi:hypothetical protein